MPKDIPLAATYTIIISTDTADVDLYALFVSEFGTPSAAATDQYYGQFWGSGIQRVNRIRSNENRDGMASWVNHQPDQPGNDRRQRAGGRCWQEWCEFICRSKWASWRCWRPRPLASFAITINNANEGSLPGGGGGWLEAVVVGPQQITYSSLEAVVVQVAVVAVELQTRGWGLRRNNDDWRWIV